MKHLLHHLLYPRRLHEAISLRVGSDSPLSNFSDKNVTRLTSAQFNHTI
jgi:hypothetical protein